MRDKPRVALLGYGLAGRWFHAPLIATSPRLELRTVVTSREVPAGLRRLDRPEQVWEQADDLDLVVVATPNHTHAPLAAAAIDAGLHVVVDKPLGTDMETATALVERSEAAGGRLTAFHNRRWDSDTLTLQRLMAADTLGRVHRFESRFERWRPELKAGWRESDPADRGGVLLDLGTHLVDAALHLFGPVRSVHREVRTLRPGALVEDDVFLALEHASGTISHLWASAVAAAGGPRLRVLGERGGYVKDDVDGQEEAVRAGRPPAPESPGRLYTDTVREVPSEQGRWQSFYDGVAAWLLDGDPPPVDPRDALGTLQILIG